MQIRQPLYLACEGSKSLVGPCQRRGHGESRTRIDHSRLEYPDLRNPKRLIRPCEAFDARDRWTPGHRVPD